MSRAYVDDLADLNPKNWLKKYRKTTPAYLLRMALFYHVLGLALMYAGSAVASEVIDGYEVPFFPVSLVSAITAGPIEETLFFGLPFYLGGNIYYLLGAGAFWSILHVFNTAAYDAAGLAYGGFLFAIPHLFFSIRTWISKKGWFAVAFHSAWNLAVLSLFCFAGLRTCVVFGSGADLLLDILLLPAAASLCIMTYLLHLRSEGRDYHKRYLIAAVIALAAVQAPLIWLNFAGPL